jgi:uncharacterized protein YllA (UPF0747 family)
MKQAVSWSWSTEAVDPRRVPGLDPHGVLGRLTDGALGPGQGLPLLDPGHPPVASGSDFLDRAALAERLSAYNAEMGNPLGERTVEAIRSDGMFVIAGQQPGLLLSPVYTVLKAVSAVALAGRMSQRTDGPGVPGFWIASEDHDVEEVRGCVIGGKKMTIDHPELEGPGPRPPVAALSLEPWRDAILDFLEKALGDAPHRAALVELVGSVSFASYPRMFAELLGELMGSFGLVLIDPMRLRSLTAPVLGRMVERWASLEEALERGKRRIGELGLEAPLDRVNLFRIERSGDGIGPRHAVEDPESLTASDVEAEPEAYSPGAALRPIVQDAVLPTAATIGGPTELAYLWQIDPLYEAAGVRRSATHPRISATFIDRRTARRAEPFGLRGGALLGASAAAEEYDPRRFIEDGDDVDAIDRRADSLLEAIEQLDPADRKVNEKLIRKAEDSIRHQTHKVVDRVLTARLSRKGLGRDALEAVAERVTPR